MVANSGRAIGVAPTPNVQVLLISSRGNVVSCQLSQRAPERVSYHNHCLIRMGCSEGQRLSGSTLLNASRHTSQQVAHGSTLLERFRAMLPWISLACLQALQAFALEAV